ncbi:hypothetical protein TIFTF001_030527 [Ficus carica]|uniref:Uncharacterized protein n=1 Tax=Ficus carica TaxID=3494 RepID=A0AA88DUD8_FICCA|nr:hypothetical protein TIFTF001_030527 [Ficus carica]
MEGGDSGEVLREINRFNGRSKHPMPQCPQPSRNKSEDYDWKSNHRRWILGQTQHCGVRTAVEETMNRVFCSSRSNISFGRTRDESATCRQRRMSFAHWCEKDSSPFVLVESVYGLSGYFNYVD